MSNYIQLTFAYEGTDFTRNYKISDVADSIAADTSGIKTRIQAVNASLAAGQDVSLATAFRSDDFDSAHNIGSFKKIIAAQVVEHEEIPLIIEVGE